MEGIECNGIVKQITKNIFCIITVQLAIMKDERIQTIQKYSITIVYNNIM